MQLSLEETKDLSNACWDAIKKMDETLEGPVGLYTVGEIQAIKQYSNRLHELTNKLYNELADDRDP